MKLSDILKGAEYTAVQFKDSEIAMMTFASNKVEQGAIFIAQQGVHTDGHRYIDDAIQRGAIAVVCQQLPMALHPNVTYLQTADSNKMMGIMASNYYDNPSRKLNLVGITGTNGKTTTVTSLYQLFRNHGYHVGLISTIVNKIDDDEQVATHTTPDAIALNALLARMVAVGCQYCFMEVSSHAIVQERIAGLTFRGALFSNITHDHLDFHKTMANYIAAKKKFFDDLSPEAFALTNIDDKHGMVMVQNTQAKVYTYSMQRMADFRGKIIESTFHGLHLQLNGKEVWTRLVGCFNAYNLIAIYATTILLGLSAEEALLRLSELAPVSGRFEVITDGQTVVIVDYAHTPDALENVLSTIQEVKKPNEKIITVVGCGGDRDPLKRPEMAQIAAQYSDTFILTSDNPRTEDPEEILRQMEQGLSKRDKTRMLKIVDRRQAIKTACMIGKDEVVLVAGKGHETYQEVNGVRHYLDDREEVRQALGINNDESVG